MAKVIGDGSNIAGGTNGALQDDFPTSVGNVLDNPKAAIVIEYFAAAETTLKPVEGYDVSLFLTINDAPSSVVGGGDMTMFNDTPAARAFMEFLRDPRGRVQAWAELRRLLVREQEAFDTSVYPDEILKKTASAIGEATVR